jgi:hypothetical protein
VYPSRGTVVAVTISFVPMEIPRDLCSTVGEPLAALPGECLNKVIVDVGDDSVSAPVADVAGLREVVAQAKDKGIDLKIVVLPLSPPIEASLRDVAWEVEQAYPGSTVLVMSPGMAGTYSAKYDRVTLESGQDKAKLPGGFVHGAQGFVNELQKPEFPWTLLTIALVLVVVIGAVLTRLLQLRARRPAPNPEPPVSSASTKAE